MVSVNVLETRLNEFEKRMDGELGGIKKAVGAMDDRVANIENMADTVNDIGEMMGSVFKWVRRGFPIVITALVTSEIVDGKLGRFLGALVGH